MTVNTIGDEKLRIFRPAIVLLCEFDFGFAERLAVGFVGILLVRRAVADVAVNHNERRFVAVCEEVFVSARQLQQIIGISNARHVPAIADETGHGVVAVRPACRTVQGHAIVVVNPAKISKLKMTGQRGRFSRYAFHQVPIATERIDVKVEKIETGPIEVPGQELCCDGHSYAVADTLSKRPRSGFYAGGQVRLRMARRAAIQLSEPLDLLHGHGEVLLDLAVLVNVPHARQMQ